MKRILLCVTLFISSILFISCSKIEREYSLEKRVLSTKGNGYNYKLKDLYLDVDIGNYYQTITSFKSYQFEELYEIAKNNFKKCDLEKDEFETSKDFNLKVANCVLSLGNPYYYHHYDVTDKNIEYYANSNELHINCYSFRNLRALDMFDIENETLNNGFYNFADNDDFLGTYDLGQLVIRNIEPENAKKLKGEILDANFKCVYKIKGLRYGGEKKFGEWSTDSVVIPLEISFFLISSEGAVNSYNITNY